MVSCDVLAFRLSAMVTCCCSWKLGYTCTIQSTSRVVKQVETAYIMLPDMKMNIKPSVIWSFKLGDFKWLCNSQFLPSDAVIVSEAAVRHPVPSSPITPLSHMTLCPLEKVSLLPVLSFSWCGTATHSKLCSLPPEVRITPDFLPSDWGGNAFMPITDSKKAQFTNS